MLKWISSQRGNNPRSTSPTRSNHPSPVTTSPWLTDDPLATINVNLDTKRKSVATSKRRQLAESNQQQIYSVTRTNPLFIDSTPTADVMSNLTDGEKRFMDESRSSNRSEQCQTPSSSGYESAADPRRRLAGNNAATTGSNHKQQQQQQQQESAAAVHNHRHQRHHQQQHLVDELSPASDYRRQFVLGPRTLDRSSPRKMTATPDVAAAAAAADGLIPSQQRIGKANLLHQNSFYVTKIHMPLAVGEGTTSTNQKTTTTTDAVIHDEWEKYERQAEDQGNCFNTQKKKIPHPVWPTTTGNLQQRTSNSSAIVQQNENYVTKILIAPKMFEMSKQQQDEEETMDSIVTHSLLVMTSYDDQQSIEDEDLKKETKMEITAGPAELSEIRQLSQTLSQSRVVATVSRALSKSSAGSSSSSETTYPTTPTTNAESSSSSSSSSSTVGGSIARRISMMKERWDKSSRRRLLTESDEDDPSVTTISNRRLDHVYVPQNGDVNFSIGQLNPRNNNHSAAGEPFSYLAGIYHPAAITEEVTVNESQVCAVIVPSNNNRMSNHYDPFEQDRLSNSSSRSSGSRRVTFSADTVDNEHSTKSSTTNSIASNNSSSASCSDKNLSNSVNIIEELKLNPHYLPHRYQQQQPSVNSSVVDVVGTSSSRLAGYYSYNLQAQLDNYNAKGQGEKVSTWEHYHQQDAISSKGATTNRPGSSSAGVVRLDPYNNLQLHPNYVAACQERSICVDFTLDGVEEALLQRRSDSHKLRRRICCCLLLLLCLVVLVIVVIVISLYLSQGQKIFGSLGPF